MSNSTYFKQWRSKEECLALELTETTNLPVEEVGMGEDRAADFANFQAGDYEVRQNGRVFGRTKAQHEARFKPAVSSKAKPEAKKKARRVVRQAEPEAEQLPATALPS